MQLFFRNAVKNDLLILIDLLSDDILGKKREDNSRPINAKYEIAFENITNDKNNELIVVEYNGKVVGFLQLTFIYHLSQIGSMRCLIESVRTNSEYRGKGIGRKLFQWAISYAKEKGCVMVQLTSDKKRKDALRFYESLGFIASHEGFKLQL